MAEPWIRVHAGLIDKPVIDRLSTALDVSEHEAIGLLVTFWGAVSKNVVGGRLDGVSDRQIEGWVRWHGQRGAFAAWVRTHHLDADGRVNEWDEYAGALESRREKERERLRNKRHGVAQQSEDVAQQLVNERKLLLPARANETIRNEEHPSSSAANATLRASLSSRAGIEAMTTIVKSAASSDACVVAIASMLTGNDPAVPAPSFAAFERAVIDYAANGERWNAAHFRTYLKRAAKDADQPRAHANGRQSQGRAALVLGEIRDLIQSHQQPGQGITRFIRRDDVERLGTDVLAAYDAIGGSERVIGATGEKMSFLIRDFADALKAANEVAA